MIHAAYSELTPARRRELREAYVKEQGCLCFYCGEALAQPPPAEAVERTALRFKPISGFVKDILSTRGAGMGWDCSRHPINLQHNHDTDLTEGAVHSLCNLVMWVHEGR